MTVSHPLSADLVELIAERFGALSEPVRIRLLDRLREGEASVLELTAAIGTTPAERLQAPRCAPPRGHRCAPQTGQLRLLLDRRRARLRTLRDRLRQPRAATRIARPGRRRCAERLIMLELFQTEWCPASRRIRQRLTELGLDYLNHQVPVEREERTVLFARAAPTPCRRCWPRTARRLSARARSSPISSATTASPSRPRPIEPRRPKRAAATWRRNADARHWLHTDAHDAAPIRRGRRARPSRAQGGGLRGAVRDRRAGDDAREARAWRESRT